MAQECLSCDSLVAMIAGPVVLPEQIGLSTMRLQRLDAVVQSFIERGVIAGAVTLIARKGQIAHFSAKGHMDIASGRPMQTDTIFRLASMTKPIVSVAVLMLLEEGRILLTEPVSAFVPSFKNLQVAVPNAMLPTFVPTQLAAGDFHLVPAARDITLRDLLTHTAGLGSATAGPGAEATLALLEQRQADNTLADLVQRMAEVPLSFQPGSAWEYSGIFGFDTLARVVEIVSGTAIDQFFQQRIFERLGIQDTWFHVPTDRLARVATVYDQTPDGLQPATPMRKLAASTDPSSRRYHSGGGGLAGTAMDYARFAMMLANGGLWHGGERLLARKTVELMASNHIGQLPWARPVTDLRGYRFGLGVRVLDDPAEASTLASRGTFGWEGAFGTNSWIDPAEQMVGILLIQRQAGVIDPELGALWARIQTTAYQAIED
jgi:CubicO group peptidase (beta-lactamase class C family)